MRTGRNAMQERLGLGAALSRLFRLMSPRRRAQLLFFLVLMLFGALAEVAAVASVVPFLALLARVAEVDRVGWVYDLLRWLGADSYAEQIRVSALLFMLTAVIAGVLRILLELWRQRFILGLGHDNAVEVHRRILLQPYGFHLGRNSSEMLSAQEQVEVLFGTILLSLMQGAVAAVIAGLILVALISIDPFTATVAVLAFALIYGLVWSVAGPRLARNSRILGSAYAARLQTLQESLGGIRDIIIDQSHGVYLDAFRTIDRQFVGARASTAIIASAPRHIIEAAGMILIAGIAILIVEREGGLAPALPILGAVALGALRLVPFMQQMYHGWSILSGNQSALVEVLRLLQLPLPPEDASAGGGKPLPCRSDIRFDKVSFAYETQRRPAIKDVSFIIPAGSRAALVGRSGSGKSTVADLLMGLLEPTGGEIRIDGSVLSAAGRQRWRRSIGHVPQAIFLADTAIAQNIAFGVDPAAIDVDRVYEAARLAQLDEFVSELPDGFATRVGEDGIQLSGGQRQRIGIARALYKRPSVLILDEATSALDESTEAEVMQGLDALLGEKVTIIIITHRRSAMQGCELVIRLEAGEVVEGAADAVAQEGPRAI